MTGEGAVSTAKKTRRATEFVNLTIRIHYEARRQLRIRAAEEDRNIEDIVRSLIYPKIGMAHLDGDTKAAALK